jgi:hypothetical protein
MSAMNSPYPLYHTIYVNCALSCQTTHNKTNKSKVVLTCHVCFGMKKNFRNFTRLILFIWLLSLNFRTKYRINCVRHRNFPVETVALWTAQLR